MSGVDATGGTGDGVEDEVVRVWSRRLAWLQEHAPITANAVRPPAPPAVLTLAQSVTGTRWPIDVQRFYRLCGGTDRARGASFLPGLRVLALSDPEHGDAIVEAWRHVRDDTHERAAQEAGQSVDPREANLRAMAGLDPTPPMRWDPAPLEAQPAGAEAGMWLPSRLPIAEDLSGSLLFTDRRAGPQHGYLLLVDKVDCDHRAERRPSLTALLADVLTAVTTDEALAGTRWRPEVVDGALTWTRLARDAAR